ncbi:hypothetical protein HNP87_001482 [Methanococcus maripaludis]|uniref:Uncharacterized protein n=1 Tax=Methanococcus maripaludis TaxID=39152 RepID=A0A7J9NK49_METMI|nr:hypothetical protein [Methanococcus maripaludis]MBA2840950.1 hypothetical protein [Methanococcus maripaludis]
MRDIFKISAVLFSTLGVAVYVFNYGLYDTYKSLFLTIEHIGTFAAAIFALAVIYKMNDQLEEMKKQRFELEVQSEELVLQRAELKKPELIVNLIQDKENFGIMHLYLENIGGGIAKNVEIRFSDEINNNFEDILHNKVSELPIFSRTINFLAPTQRKLLFTINSFDQIPELSDIVFKFKIICDHYIRHLEVDLFELKTYVGYSNNNQIGRYLNRINDNLSKTNQHLNTMSKNVKNLQPDFKMDDKNVENFKTAGLVLDKISKICKKNSKNQMDSRILKTQLNMSNDKLNPALEFLETMGYLKLRFVLGSHDEEGFCLIWVLKRDFTKKE